MIAVDTGILFGAADSDDPQHRRCADVLEAHAGELVAPVPVIVETAWLVESRLGPASLKLCRPPNGTSAARSRDDMAAHCGAPRTGLHPN